MKTLFERIANRELEAEWVYEDEQLFAIKDKYPKAPVHLLIIPKEPIPNLQSLEPEEYPLLGEIVRVAQKLARELGLAEKGYRLLVNNGPDGGQVIPHLHFHLLGGRALGDEG